MSGTRGMKTAGRSQVRQVFMLVLLFVGMVLTAAGVALCGYWLSHRYQQRAETLSEQGNSEKKELMLAPGLNSDQQSLFPKAKSRSPPETMTSANVLQPPQSFGDNPDSLQPPSVALSYAPSSAIDVLSEPFSETPSATPSNVPSDQPSDAPSDIPSSAPDKMESFSNEPSADFPSDIPSGLPSQSPIFRRKYSNLQFVASTYSNAPTKVMPLNPPKVRGGGQRNMVVL